MSETFVTVKEFKVTYRPHFAHGTFGRLYKATDTRTNETVIGKELLQTEDAECNERIVQDIKRELDIIMKLQNHKNIVKYIAHYEIDNVWWIFMEFCDRGDLKAYLKANAPLEIEHIANICYQAANGIAFMHQQTPPIIHRDIKLQNILMKTEENETVLKICDFGFSRLYNEKTSSSVMRPTSFRSVVGTRPFMAPEFSDERDGRIRYDFTIDVFSLGLVFLLILDPSGSHFFPLSVEMKAKGEFVSIGAEMIQNHKDGKPLPKVIMTQDHDSPIIKRMKRIIDGMVQFQPGDRRPIHDVANELSEIKNLIKANALQDHERTTETLPKILEALALSTTQKKRVATTALLGARFDKSAEYDITSHCHLLDTFFESEEMDESMEITFLPLIPLFFHATSVGDDIIVAADDLTFHCKQGRGNKIATDEYHSVICQGSKLFACKDDGKSIDVFDLNTLSQICTYEVLCPGDEDGKHGHSIMVSTGRLYIACYEASHIFVMEMTGRILKTYEKTKINGLTVNSPFLCKIPLVEEGVVIADNCNDRLCMLHDDTWSALRLHPQPIGPFGAAFTENVLYVLCIDLDKDEGKDDNEREDEGEDEEDEKLIVKIVKYIPAP